MRTTGTLSRFLGGIVLAIGVALPGCNGADLLVGKALPGEPPAEAGTPAAQIHCSNFVTRITSLPNELRNIGLRVDSLDSQFIYIVAELTYARDGNTAFEATWGIATSAQRNMGGTSGKLYGSINYPGMIPPARFEQASPWRLGPHYPRVVATPNGVHVLEARTVRLGSDWPDSARYEEYGLTLNTYEQSDQAPTTQRPVSGYACQGQALHAANGNLYVATSFPDAGPSSSASDGGDAFAAHSRLTMFTADGQRRESAFFPGTVRCAFDDDALYFVRENGGRISLHRRSLLDESETELATNMSARALAIGRTNAYFYAAGEAAIVGIDKHTGKVVGRIPLPGTGAIVAVDDHVFWWAGYQLMHSKLDGTCLTTILTHSSTNALVGDGHSLAFVDASKDTASLYEVLIDPAPPVAK